MSDLSEQYDLLEFLRKWTNLAHSMRAAAIQLSQRSCETISHVDEDDPRVVALALLARTLGHLKAIISLTEQGLIVEILTLARSCYENSFRIARLDADGDSFVREMRKEMIAGMRARGRAVLENTSEMPPGRAEDIRFLLREIKSKHGGASALAPKEVVKNTSLSESYLAYLLLSRESHPTLSSLARYLEDDGAEDGSPIFVLEPIPTTKELVDALVLACTATLLSCTGICRIIGLIQSPPLLYEAIQAFNDLIEADLEALS